MGGCPCKTFTINRGSEAGLKCIEPFIFSVADAETVLMEAELGDYLLYRDFTTDRVLLSVRYNSHIRHHRISEDGGLYYLNGQPYPYLDSIVLYHRQHRLDSLKLKKQAQLSARVVRLFAHKITSANGNNVYTLNNESVTPDILQQHTLHDNNNLNHHNNQNHIHHLHHHDNNNLNHHDNQNHIHHLHHYDNASFVADEVDEEGVELEEKRIQKDELISTEQTKIQTEAPTPNSLPNHQSNGMAIMIPEPEINQLIASKVASGEVENKNEIDNYDESSSTPRNTTPTENAIESPQPDAILVNENFMLKPSDNNFFLNRRQSPTTTPSTSPFKISTISGTSNVLSTPSSTTLKPDAPSLLKTSSFSGSPYFLLSSKSSSIDAVNGKSPFKPTKPARRSQSHLSTSSSPFSRKSNSIAQDSDHQSIALSSWTHLAPSNGSVLSDYKSSTVGSHASLISITSSESKIIYTEHF